MVVPARLAKRMVFMVGDRSSAGGIPGTMRLVPERKGATLRGFPGTLGAPGRRTHGLPTRDDGFARPPGSFEQITRAREGPC